MTDASMTLIELLQKHDEGGFLRAVTGAALRTLLEHDSARAGASSRSRP